MSGSTRGPDKPPTVSDEVKQAFLSNPYVHSVLKSYLMTIIHLRMVYSKKTLLATELLNPSSSWKESLVLNEVRNAVPPLVDVGCGWGWLLFEASKFGIFTIGIDRDGKLIRHTKSILNLMGVRFPLIEASATHLPLRDSAVGMLAYVEVIEHIRQTNLIFSEARRVLRTGGKVLITTPNAYSIERFIAKIVSMFLGIEPSGPHLHKKFFRPFMVHEAAKANGFCITRSLGIGLFMVTIVFLGKLLGLRKLSIFLRILDLRLAEYLPTFTSCCLVILKKLTMK